MSTEKTTQIEQDNSIKAINEMLDRFRDWSREWDNYMNCKQIHAPLNSDSFAQSLAKQYEVKLKNNDTENRFDAKETDRTKLDEIALWLIGMF